MLTRNQAASLREKMHNVITAWNTLIEELAANDNEIGLGVEFLDSMIIED